MQAALLPERGVVKIAGADARHFLNGIATNDLGKAGPDGARFAALLTPQGKIVVDFIAVEAAPEDGGGFFLDCPKALAGALVDKLTFYRLRAKVTIEDLSAALGVMAVWDTQGQKRSKPTTACATRTRACRRSARASSCRRNWRPRPPPISAPR